MDPKVKIEKVDPDYGDAASASHTASITGGSLNVLGTQAALNANNVGLPNCNAINATGGTNGSFTGVTNGSLGGVNPMPSVMSPLAMQFLSSNPQIVPLMANLSMQNLMNLLQQLQRNQAQQQQLLQKHLQQQQASAQSPTTPGSASGSVSAIKQESVSDANRVFKDAEMTVELMETEDSKGVALVLESDNDNASVSLGSDTKPGVNHVSPSNEASSVADCASVDATIKTEIPESAVGGATVVTRDVKPTPREKEAKVSPYSDEMTKDKLWELYLKGKVEIDLTSESKRRPPSVDDPFGEEFSRDWELIREEGVVVAISCRLCPVIGKKPTPIPGDSVEKLKNFGEQHLVLRHKREPKGSTEQIGSRAFQCAGCALYFAGENLLKLHRKRCEVPEEDADASAGGRSSARGRKKRKAGDAEEDEEKPTTEKKTRGRARKPGASKTEPESLHSAQDEGHQSNSSKDCRSDCESSAKSTRPKTETSSVQAEDAPEASPAPDDDAPPSPPPPRSPPPPPSPPVNSFHDPDSQRRSLPEDQITLGNRWLERPKDEIHAGFACPLCKSRPLSQPVFIEDHVAAIHFKQRRYVCVICRDAGKDDPSWSHKSSLEDHLKRNHSLQHSRREKLDLKLTEIRPLLPDVVNTMRLFFKINPKPGNEVKPKYAAKKPNIGDNNNKKSKCPECDLKFYTQEDRTLIDHIMWRHRDSPRYHCFHCGEKTSFGMVAGFEDHCKKEHGCDKPDFVQQLFMKVDRVPEDLAKQYYIDDDEYRDLHKGRVVVSDDEEEGDVVDGKDEGASRVEAVQVAFRGKEMFLLCDVCQWSLSSRELFLVEKIQTHRKAHVSD